MVSIIVLQSSLGLPPPQDFKVKFKRDTRSSEISLLNPVFEAYLEPKSKLKATYKLNEALTNEVIFRTVEEIQLTDQPSLPYDQGFSFFQTVASPLTPINMLFKAGPWAPCSVISGILDLFLHPG